jgi:hypothetical protein
VSAIAVLIEESFAVKNKLLVDAVHVVLFYLGLDLVLVNGLQ